MPSPFAITKLCATAAATPLLCYSSCSHRMHSGMYITMHAWVTCGSTTCCNSMPLFCLDIMNIGLSQKVKHMPQSHLPVPNSVWHCCRVACLARYSGLYDSKPCWHCKMCVCVQHAGYFSIQQSLASQCRVKIHKIADGMLLMCLVILYTHTYVLITCSTPCCCTCLMIPTYLMAASWWYACCCIL